MNVFDYLWLRILSHYEAAQEILKGNMPVPRFALIYPSYMCNHNCPGCEYREENRLNKIMTDNQLTSAVYQCIILGVKGMEFSGGGEPTLQRNLADAIFMAKSAGLSVGLLTNGTHLDRIVDVVDCLSYIRISLDAATSETFKKARNPKTPKSDYYSVISNIEQVIAERHKTNISLKFLISKINMHEIKKMARLADDLGVNSLQFRAVRGYGPNILSRHDEYETQTQIDEIKNDFSLMPIIGTVIKSKLKSKCWLTPVQVVIDTFGDVYPCCYYRHRKKRLCFGNIFQKPLKEIWYSDAHRKAIDNLDIEGCNLLDCRFHKYNELMNKMMIEDQAQLQFI